MGLLTELGRHLFAIFFVPPPIPSFGAIRTVPWSEACTVKNLGFGVFWGWVFVFASTSGLWPKLWELVTIDAISFSEWTRSDWPGCAHLCQMFLFFSLSGVLGAFLYWCKPRSCRWLYDGVRVFARQMNLSIYTLQRVDNDGDVMVIKRHDEERGSKSDKKRLGVRHKPCSEQETAEVPHVDVSQSMCCSDGRVGDPDQTDIGHLRQCSNGSFESAGSGRHRKYQRRVK